MEIKTVGGNSIRLLIEALKDILQDVNFIINDKGIKIVSMDSSHTVLIFLKLDSENFDIFNIDTYTNEDGEVVSKEYILGVNMPQLFKLIKVIGTNDTLTFFLKENNHSELGIKIEDCNRNSITTYFLKLLDLNYTEISVPPVTFKSIITIPSQLFQKHIRDMNNLSDLIEIKCTNNQLFLTIKGEFCHQETILGESISGVNFEESNSNEIIQGYFSLKHLVQFTKCTGLCQQLKIFLKNNYPIIFEYSVSTLGIIRLCLAPKISNN